MISDKVFPSFYMVELEGDAVGAIIPGNFGIERIALGSTDFSSDLTAAEALNTALDFILATPDFDLGTHMAESNYNPEFYPSVGEIIPTEEQLAALQEAQAASDEMQEALGVEGKTATVITRVFDPIGDFVEQRHTFTGANFKIEGKIAANPQTYAMQKHAAAAHAEMFKYNKPQQVVH